MKVTRYINTPSYGGREHFFVVGSLLTYLNWPIADLQQGESLPTMLDLFLVIAWAGVLDIDNTKQVRDFGYEIRTGYDGYIEIVFYRRN